MKKLCVLLLALSLCGVSVGKTCAEPAISEQETLANIDRKLNDTYRQILKLYADDPVFIESFKNAQRAWLKFRDAELAALFPHAKEDGYYGSILNDAWAHWQARLTEERCRQLSVWIEGVEEGDVYSGSIRFKD